MLIHRRLPIPCLRRHRHTLTLIRLRAVVVGHKTACLLQLLATCLQSHHLQEGFLLVEEEEEEEEEEGHTLQRVEIPLNLWYLKCWTLTAATGRPSWTTTRLSSPPWKG